MSIEEIITELHAMGRDGFCDQEIAHSRADELLLVALGELGHSDVVNAYRDARERVDFWYA